MQFKKTKQVKKFSDARKIMKRHDHKILGLHPLINGSSVEFKDGKWHLNIFAIEEHPSFRLFEKIKVEGMSVNVKVVGVITSLINRRTKIRPTPGGYSVGHPDISAGTLGTAVYKSSAPSKAYILSNNHVLADKNRATIGDPILQPGAYDGGQLVSDQIATLTDYEEINFFGEINYLDAAIAEADEYDDLSLDIAELSHWVGEIIDPEVGQTVTKSGRTSAVTEGTITEFSGQLQVDYSDDPYVYPRILATFDDQIITTGMASGGDSGSLLIEKTSGKAVGLLFAGGSTTTIYNRIDLVVDRFGISFFPARVEKSIQASYDINYTEKYLKANYNIRQFEKEIKARYHIKGTSTEIDPYLITDVYQLQHFTDVSGHYQLGGNIDATETSIWNDGEGFIPLTTNNCITFNGNYNEIYNLYINRPNENHIGLFGSLPLNYSSTIQNVWLRDINITGGDYTAGLCARNVGREITNCHVNGIITGIANVGGLIGQCMYGDVRKCSTEGIVYGKDHVGGLIGDWYNNSIYDSFSSMSILQHPDHIGDCFWFGSFVGGISFGNIAQHCYANGLVENISGTTGGLSGSTPTTDNHNYWDVETTGQPTSRFGEAKTLVQMRQQSTFVEWDFINTWYNIETVTAPLHRHDYWLVDASEASHATDTFDFVKLTDHMEEDSEAICVQEIVSLTDILPANSYAEDSFHNQVTINPLLPVSAIAAGDFDAAVTAARNRTEEADTSGDFECVNWTKWLIENKYYSKQYTFVLTGHQNGLSDLSLSISSFQARIRTATPTFASVVLPAKSDTIAGINLRPDGEIVVSIQFVFREEIIYDQEIVRVGLKDIRLDEGSINRTISLSGHGTETHIGQAVNLSNPMIQRLIDGKRTYRCEPDIFVRPGDTVTINNETFQTDMVTWAVDSLQEWMEVREV